MIDKIAQGVMQKYNSDATFGSILSGGMFFQRAPQDVSFPYGVFFITGIEREEIMGGATNALFDVSIQFSVFTDATDGGSYLAGLMSRLDSVFDWVVLQVDGYNCFKMQPEVMHPILYTDEIWQGSKDYSLGLQKF